MSDYYLDKLNDLLTEMEKDHQIVKKTVDRPDRPQLMICISGGRTYYFAFHYKDGHRRLRLINKDPERIYRLAHKAYVKEYVRRLKANREVLSAAVGKLLPLDYRSMLKDLPKHFDLLDPELVKTPHKSAEKLSCPNPSRDVPPVEARLFFGGTDVWDWASEPYCENTDHPEHKTHTTRRGLYCRSKSEALIFEIYMALDLPFHYDETITIGWQWISPDFIGVRRDGRFIYHEHRGLHSELYRARNDWKSGLYAAADIYQGDNLLYTFDDPAGNLNTKLIETQIRDMYKL